MNIFSFQLFLRPSIGKMNSGPWGRKALPLFYISGKMGFASTLSPGPLPTSCTNTGSSYDSQLMYYHALTDSWSSSSSHSHHHTITITLSPSYSHHHTVTSHSHITHSPSHIHHHTVTITQSHHTFTITLSPSHCVTYCGQVGRVQSVWRDIEPRSSTH